MIGCSFPVPGAHLRNAAHRTGLYPKTACQRGGVAHSDRVPILASRLAFGVCVIFPQHHRYPGKCPREGTTSPRRFFPFT